MSTDHRQRCSPATQVWADNGHNPAAARLAAVTHVHVARTTQEARARWEPYYRDYLGEIAKATAVMRDPPPFDFARFTAPGGMAICGSPAEVTERLLAMHEEWQHDEHFLQLDLGGLPWPFLGETMELIASEVLPAVEKTNGWGVRPGPPQRWLKRPPAPASHRNGICTVDRPAPSEAALLDQHTR